MKNLLSLLVFLIIPGLAGCAGTPAGIDPVTGFQVDRYLGKWYEIARLDHPFERGLSNVTAHYSLRDDGDIRVINRGYNESDGRWEEAEGRAKFISGPDVGSLKVSFFGPFYGSYIIFELDREDYQYAFVSGPDTSYLWLLARTPTVHPDIVNKFIEKSKSLGFDTDKLIYVKHDETPEAVNQQGVDK